MSNALADVIPMPLHIAVVKELRARGIPVEANEWIQLAYVTEDDVNAILNRDAKNHIPSDGILIPFFDLRGKPITYRDKEGVERPFCRIRLLKHYQPSGKKHPQRYMQPPHSGNHLYVPQAPGLNWTAIAKDTTTNLYMPEGEFKAIVLALRGHAAVAVTGVWSWRMKVDSDDDAPTTEPGSAPIPDLNWFDYSKRKVYITFDSDVTTKPQVQQARAALGKDLFSRHGTPLNFAVPRLPNHDKTGIDDWFKARGAKADDEFEALRRSSESPWVLLPVDANDIMKMEIKQVSFLVDELVLEAGLICLAGFQKRGKSFMALSLAIAVACGTQALGHFKVRKARKVLYIAFEDNAARIKTRLAMLGFPDGAPPNLKLVFAKDMKLGAEGFAMIERWVEDNEGGMVIADTFQRLRGLKAKSNNNAYEQDVAELSPLQEMAMRLRFAMVIIHHLTKTKGTDPFAQVSGSVGIVATCDLILVLDRKFKDLLGMLHVQNRDAADTAFAMRFDAGKWTYSGSPEEVGKTPLQQKILDVLRMAGEGAQLTPSELGKLMNRSKQSLTRPLDQLQENGSVVWVKDGRYALSMGSVKC